MIDTIGIIGASYGGLLALQLTIELEKKGIKVNAAVTDRAVYDLQGILDGSDIGYRLFNDNIDPEGNPLYQRHTPSILAREFPEGTPLLIIHGTMDLRVPYQQAIAMFSELTFRNREVALLPIEGNHSAVRSAKAGERILRLKSILYWFQKYL
jgi:dipeptidyl aminopeptidase/acylaminoacyl peptidase